MRACLADVLRDKGVVDTFRVPKTNLFGRKVDIAGTGPAGGNNGILDGTSSAWVKAQKIVHLILIRPRPDKFLAIFLIRRDAHLDAVYHHTIGLDPV